MQILVQKKEKGKKNKTSNSAVFLKRQKRQRRRAVSSLTNPPPAQTCSLALFGLTSWNCSAYTSRSVTLSRNLPEATSGRICQTYLPCLNTYFSLYTSTRCKFSILFHTYICSALLGKKKSQRFSQKPQKGLGFSCSCSPVADRCTRVLLLLLSPEDYTSSCVCAYVKSVLAPLSWWLVFCPLVCKSVCDYVRVCAVSFSV